ncbi:alpha/beta hydrolase [Undibacterium fentianense]|uniref:Alpha/beta hydrolase n=1 Tax=Undibacterium fentianense TaxID=2828728 RepID=A0A941IFK6_9BURK|nr:alpha/beta hydrolase [Undibacterium fentianense]MBR7800462.1 alpha/beta hydrolase [Undibacterium fentianense]
MNEDLSILSRTASPPDATLRYGDHVDQIADIRYGAAGDDRPLLVLIHGGFWKPEYDRAHAEAMSSALATAGWTTLTLEYRRVSGEPDLTLDDVMTALSSLPANIARHNGQIVLLGHSAGGHLVLWAAAQCAQRGLGIALRGVVALAPAADLQMAHAMHLGDGAVLRFLGQDPIHRADVNPMLLPTPVVATTLIQGECDEIVPPAIVVSYCAAFPATRLICIPNCGHFALIDPASAAWERVMDELQRITNL